MTTRIHLELRPISHDYYWPVNSFAMVGDKSEWLARCGESRVVPLHQGGSESERSERLAMILEGAARELREGQS